MWCGFGCCDPRSCELTPKSTSHWETEGSLSLASCLQIRRAKSAAPRPSTKQSKLSHLPYTRTLSVHCSGTYGENTASHPAEALLPFPSRGPLNSPLMLSTLCLRPAGSASSIPDATILFETCLHGAHACLASNNAAGGLALTTTVGSCEHTRKNRSLHRARH